MMQALFSQAVSEVGSALHQIDPADFEAACSALVQARHIGLYGCGREALQVRGFAMRLFHLGLSATPVGDVSMPALGEGDWLLAVAGPGELATVNAHMATARNAGASVLFVTSVPETPSATLADLVLTIPAQTMASDSGQDASSVLAMGSSFEGALFFLFEIMVLRIGEVLEIDAAAMRARHTNME